MRAIAQCRSWCKHVKRLGILFFCYPGCLYSLSFCDYLTVCARVYTYYLSNAVFAAKHANHLSYSLRLALFFSLSLYTVAVMHLLNETATTSPDGAITDSQ